MALPNSHFSAESKGTLKVKVKSDETPIPDIIVKLKDKDNNTYQSKTGTAGGCRIRNLEYGEYKVNLTNIPDNYKPYTEEEIDFNKDMRKLTINLEEKD